VSNRRKIKPKRYRDRLNAYGAMAPEDMALTGVEFAVEFALAILNEAVLVEGYEHARTAGPPGGPAAVATDVLVTAKSPFPDGLGSKCLAERPARATQRGEVGEGDDSTGRGSASAPLCAGLPSCSMRCNGPLPEPPGGLSFDGLPVWSVVLAHPGATQREVFGHLVPSIGRRRVKEALLEGLEQGWLDLAKTRPVGGTATTSAVRS